MADFWFNVAWTVLIALATLLSDWIAAKLISLARGFSAIQQAVDQAVADDSKLRQVREQLERVEKRAKASLIWGADLATVAVALDVATLGLWTGDQALFPFFQKWNTPTVNREIQMWLLLIVTHLVVLLFSIVFKHLHGERIESIAAAQLASPAHPLRWIPQNAWMLSSNTLGFVAVLSCFMVLTNTI